MVMVPPFRTVAPLSATKVQKNHSTGIAILILLPINRFVDLFMTNKIVSFHKTLQNPLKCRLVKA
jgi:hypothetical protein